MSFKSDEVKKYQHFQNIRVKKMGQFQFLQSFQNSVKSTFEE